MTLELLRQHKMDAKRSKCCFGQQKVEYLGHVISHQGVEANPSKSMECFSGLFPQQSNPLEDSWALRDTIENSSRGMEA